MVDLVQTTNLCTFHDWSSHCISRSVKSQILGIAYPLKPFGRRAMGVVDEDISELRFDDAKEKATAM